MQGAAAVRDYLAGEGIEVRVNPQATPSAAAAAAALGCSVAEIAKTLLFLINKQAVAVVTCGDMKVSSSRLKQALGCSGKVRLPSAEQVRAWTGYAPGGVCPFLLPQGLPVLLDQSLQRFERIYTAGGDAHSAVPITYPQLVRLTGGRSVALCVPAAPSSHSGGTG